MNISIKARIYIPLLTILILGLLVACDSNTTTMTPPSKLAKSPATETPVPEEPSESPAVSSPVDTPSPTPSNRVDIVYFHPKRRCASCISVELRTKALLDNAFKNAMDSGKLTFQTCELEDPQNASVIKKYSAVGSQLFITTIKNGNETIRHIEEVWMPKLLNDGVAFDDFMQKLISQSLKEVS